MGAMIQCWDCGGAGVFSAKRNTAGVDIQCDRCGGAGKCPAIMREWQLLGAAYAEDRQRNDRSLREEAKLRGYDVVTLSKAERGIIDPRTLREVA